MLKCDFCGAETDFVSRVALDRDYDRLTVKHVLRYACKACAEKKEKERLKALQSKEPKKGA